VIEEEDLDSLDVAQMKVVEFNDKHRNLVA
jgi:hypothetical protein